MWTADEFPGAEKVPWQLLIRARYVHDIDAFVATTIVQQVTQVATLDVATKIAAVAAESVQVDQAEKLERKVLADALSAVADFLDICPPWPPWPRPPWPRPPWPWPGPWPGPWPFADREDPFEQIATPYQDVVLRGALDLVGQVGSPQLQERLGGALKEMGGF